MEQQSTTLTDFVTQFEAQFEDMPTGTLQPSTEFRQLPEWTSMQSLIIIASFDWNYGVAVSAEELRGANTIEDLYHIVRGKLS